MNAENTDKYIHINETTWRIKFVSKETMDKIVKRGEDEYVQGYTEYSTQTMYICDEVENLKRVIIHELTHAWQDAYGHNQFNKQYDCEDVCEIVASIYNFLEKLNKEEELW